MQWCSGCMTGDGGYGSYRAPFRPCIKDLSQGVWYRLLAAEMAGGRRNGTVVECSARPRDHPGHRRLYPNPTRGDVRRTVWHPRAPDELVFISWFEGGEVFRSGVCYHRGRGRVFYFRPGHEAFPVYHMPEIQRIIVNACHWAANRRSVARKWGLHPERITAYGDHLSGDGDSPQQLSEHSWPSRSAVNIIQSTEG